MNKAQYDYMQRYGDSPKSHNVNGILRYGVSPKSPSFMNKSPRSPSGYSIHRSEESPKSPGINSIHRFFYSPKAPRLGQRNWNSMKSHRTSVEQLIRAGDSSPWSAPVSPVGSPALPRCHNSDAEFAATPKKSVLAKVREKAKKWRTSLSRKHHIDETITPSLFFSLEEEDSESEEIDPEFLGAPMYESELSPEDYKEKSRQHPRASPVISEKHLLPGSVSHMRHPANKTISETVTETLEPAYATVVEATNVITSKIQELTMSISTVPEMDEQRWDKGVSVREFIMHKLQPGEDERTLSQVISEAMSPRSGEVSVVDKVKEVVTNLLGNIDSSSVNRRSPKVQSSPVQPQSEPAQMQYASIPAPTLTRSLTTNQNPISIHAHQVVENPNQRILQFN